MNWFNIILDVIVGAEELSELKSSKFRDFLNGNILKKRFIQKQYLLFILLAILMVYYVNNRYVCESQIAEGLKLKKDLQDIKFESLTISAQLTTLGRRSFVLDYIAEKGLNLKESSVAPIIITVPGEESQNALNDSTNKSLNLRNDTTTLNAVD